MQELQELYDNEAKVMDIVKESAQVKQMLHDRTKLYDECEQLSGKTWIGVFRIFPQW